MSERFAHDDCLSCNVKSVPVEGVPDQMLRGCGKCGRVWFEDLARPRIAPSREGREVETQGRAR